ncbi:OmpP1/FadL family transporter [Nubsella zeaxanthinifaciens]|uniref:OmpP1/FadL family transporter n=1 Tax=Nubsella zeaxanthinifaciens TaxID=392412 RepID=UPI000DE37959|nr:hypothetical protein [Nubsella zeaxanthinifaciens]
MKKITMFLVVATVATTMNAYAQYSNDALRFSQTNYGSSARFKGMGNAQIGVGGDISSLGGNPAGLGLFTRSEFVLTPEFNQTSTNASFLGNNSSASKQQVNLNQLGVVFHMPTYRSKGQDTQKGLISAVIGLGYNRNNDYGVEANFSGVNNSTSVYNVFNDYSVPANSLQSANIVRSGSVSEFNISGALNISNQIYIGAALGLVSLNYDYNSTLDEDGIAQNYYINYNQTQDTKGSGVNAKLGVIFRPIPEFRIGANIQSPTWFNINDSFTEDSNDPNVLGSETYDFSYNLRTPLKASLGSSYVIGNRALISADIDFVDYSTIKFSSSDGGDTQIIANNNRDVRQLFQSAINYRIGGEVKVTDFISLRAGYGNNGSAYKDDKDEQYFATQFYSGGLGYRNKNYYFDVAYQRVNTHSTFSPYQLQGLEPVAEATNNKNNVFLTFGVRF